MLVALLLLVASYVIYARREVPHGGSLFGIVYGSLALALVLLLVFFGVRKRWHRSRLGRLESWCQSHVYLGLLVVGVALCHSGFRFEDRVAAAAFWTMTAVAASGLAGALLYTVVPLLLTRVESGGLLPDELARQAQGLALSMARVASGGSPALQGIAGDLLAEQRPGWLAGWRLLLQPGQALEGVERPWARWLREVPPAERQDLEQLLVLSRQRRELVLSLVQQQRYRNLLAVWLFVHVPLSFALLALLAAHLWGALRYWSP
ncbi:MAG TPA: hypothetical protein VFS60_10405 [Thermoanaerobaculia bacterium]|nr:hypothetical protein [Thermoanaerobaculia bacterium]